MAEQRTHTPSAPHVDAAALRTVIDRRSRELDLTRESVARAAGVGRSTLFDWLAGSGQPSAAGWQGLAAALGMSVADLFTAVGTPLTSPVERARLERGWTRGDLAQSAGVSFATVRMVEAGERVRPDAAARVAHALGLKSDFVRGSARVSAQAATPLGRAVERERLNRGWTIADLARHLGTARQLVSAWLLGSEPVAARWLPALAKFTGLPLPAVEDLVERSRGIRAVRVGAEQIKGERRRRKWSQAQLAAELGVSAATVEQWESGRRTPSSRARQRLLEVLGTTADAGRLLQENGPSC